MDTPPQRQPCCKNITDLKCSAARAYQPCFREAMDALLPQNHDAGKDSERQGMCGVCIWGKLGTCAGPSLVAHGTTQQACNEEEDKAHRPGLTQVASSRRTEKVATSDSIQLLGSPNPHKTKAT